MRTEYIVEWVDHNGGFHQCTVVTFGLPFPADIGPQCNSISSSKPTGRTFPY